jgi:hypothetical protein
MKSGLIDRLLFCADVNPRIQLGRPDLRSFFRMGIPTGHFVRSYSTVKRRAPRLTKFITVMGLGSSFHFERPAPQQKKIDT